MAKRKRNIQLKLMVTEEEKEMIQEKMHQLGTDNFGAYARKMLIDGYVIKYDFKELKALTGQIGKIGSNINQIAKRANETKTINQEDVNKALTLLEQVMQIVNKTVPKMIR